MTREFFAPRWLKAHPIVYMTSHMADPAADRSLCHRVRLAGRRPSSAAAPACTGSCRQLPQWHRDRDRPQDARADRRGARRRDLQRAVGHGRRGPRLAARGAGRRPSRRGGRPRASAPSAPMLVLLGVLVVACAAVALRVRSQRRAGKRQGDRSDVRRLDAPDVRRPRRRAAGLTAVAAAPVMQPGFSTRRTRSTRRTPAARPARSRARSAPACRSRRGSSCRRRPSPTASVRISRPRWKPRPMRHRSRDRAKASRWRRRSPRRSRGGPTAARQTASSSRCARRPATRTAREHSFAGQLDSFLNVAPADVAREGRATSGARASAIAILALPARARPVAAAASAGRADAAHGHAARRRRGVRRRSGLGPPRRRRRERGAGPRLRARLGRGGCRHLARRSRGHDRRAAHRRRSAACTSPTAGRRAASAPWTCPPRWPISRR